MDIMTGCLTTLFVGRRSLGCLSYFGVMYQASKLLTYIFCYNRNNKDVTINNSKFHSLKCSSRFRVEIDSSITIDQMI